MSSAKPSGQIQLRDNNMFPEKGFGMLCKLETTCFVQIGDNLHEMSKPIVSEKKKKIKISSATVLHGTVRIN